jgi:hypothetical protein
MPSRFDLRRLFKRDEDRDGQLVKLPDLGDLCNIPEPPLAPIVLAPSPPPDLGDLINPILEVEPCIPAPGVYIPSVKNMPDMGEEGENWCIVEHKLENGVHKYGIKSIDQAPPETRASAAMSYREAVTNLQRMHELSKIMES